MTVQTIVASPKTFEIHNTNVNEIKMQSRLILETIRKLSKKAIILYNSGDSSPWNYNSIKYLSTNERGDISLIIKSIESRRQLIPLTISRDEDKSNCDLLYSIVEQEQPLNFFILPNSGICTKNCPFKNNINTIQIGRTNTDTQFQNSMEIEPLNLSRYSDLNQVYHGFFRNIFRYTRRVDFVDKFFGSNATEPNRDTQNITLRWLYSKYKNENKMNGEFIIHTTTTDQERDIETIKNKCEEWLEGLNLGINHKIIINIYYFFSRRTNIRNKGYRKFPHERVMNTEQFAYDFNNGFNFCNLISNQIKLQKEKNCQVNLLNKKFWRENVLDTLDNLQIYKSLIRN